MNYSIHTFEITLVVDTSTFQKLLDRAYKKAKGKHRLFEKNNISVDYALAPYGITISYNKYEFKKKVKLIVNPSKILGGDDVPQLWKPNKDNISELLYILNTHIDNYFNSKYELDDFKVTRMDFTVNIKFDNKEKVSHYIKTLQRIGKVKWFSPLSDPWIDKNLSFCLKGNSNGVEFTAYDKAKQLKKQLSEIELKHKDELEARIERAEGILRIEVRLTEQKAIRTYTNEIKTSKQIKDLSKMSEHIFLDTFVRIVPVGSFCKKDDAIEIINNEVTDKTLRKKMIQLVELIPNKRSILLAQKELNYRKIDQVMDTFRSIELSPVTISKRQNISTLKNIYKYL